MTLELLAPARNIDIGIAAIDCGADAVYIAGPSFGARKAAGNSLENIRILCDYAHKFGARVFLTVNTIIYDNELEDAHRLMLDAQSAGVDAFIVQDLAIFSWDDIQVPLHASTQCSIRTPERAAFYEKTGCSRLVLERELSLDEIRLIRKSTSCELEFFVHGALCVCYSGNCYLSEYLDRRSANRGDCIQACRSLYDLSDKDGRILVRDKALLSLKDYKLLSRLEDLADAGICSFKIEGRLKNASYVQNVVKAYSEAIDKLIESHPGRYERASYGKVSGGFIPDLQKTFNRGYTSLFLDGNRGKWSSMDAPKSMGEPIGTILSVRPVDKYNVEVCIAPDSQDIKLTNGDGFTFVRSNAIVGVRADVCKPRSFICKQTPGLSKGVRLYRNFSAAFEKEVESNKCKRLIGVKLSIRDYTVYAESEDGRRAEVAVPKSDDFASEKGRMMEVFKTQLSKNSSDYAFVCSDISFTEEKVPFLPISSVNALRRSLSELLDKSSCIAKTLYRNAEKGSSPREDSVSYKDNVANSRAAAFLSDLGLDCKEKAYELSHKGGVELMRTRYCVRYELGLCQRKKSSVPAGRLYLINNGRRLALDFDCSHCEMTVKEG